MTLFGFDVSDYDPSYQPAAATFHIVKASEGAHTHDSQWATLSARVRAAKNTLLLGYHFLHSDSTPAAQAANTAAVPGVKGVPLMVDVETESDENGKVVSRPTVAQAAAYVDEARALGLNPRLVYLPKWYWQELGSPSLQPLIDRGLHLVSSAYPNQGHYPGDNGSGWASYGGMTPLIWQYSSQPLDCDAFKGTLAQLAAVLGAPIPEDDVPLTAADAKLVAEAVLSLDAIAAPPTAPDVKTNPNWQLQSYIKDIDANTRAANTTLALLQKSVAAQSAAITALAAQIGSDADTATIVAAVEAAIAKAVIHVEVDSGPAQ